VCGIAGLIGESLNPTISYRLISQILSRLEIRGSDATGIWGTQAGKLPPSGQAAIIYHKAPIRSSDFVKYDNMWKKVRKFNPNLLLMHARSATPGSGQPSINKNNHPFVNGNKTLSLVHNGKVPEHSYLKKKYTMISQCDSEIMLRIIQAEGEPFSRISDKFDTNLTEHQKIRIGGISKVWSLAGTAHMAVALGETFEDGTRHLWLWRNEYRPLWLADMRDTLGQIFFFSDPIIWWDALRDCKEAQEVLTSKQKLIEVHTEKIFFLAIDEENPSVNTNKKQYGLFNIDCDVTHTREEKDIETGTIVEDKKIPVNLICGLDKNEEPKETIKKGNIIVNSSTSSLSSGGFPETGHHNDPHRSGKWGEGYGPAAAQYNDSIKNRKKSTKPTLGGSELLKKIHTLCETIKEHIKAIDVSSKNQYETNQTSDDDLSDLVTALETVESEARTARVLLEGNS